MTHYDIINAASVVPTDKGTPNQVVVSNQEIGCKKRLRLKVQQTKHIGVSINVVFFLTSDVWLFNKSFLFKRSPWEDHFAPASGARNTGSCGDASNFHGADAVGAGSTWRVSVVRMAGPQRPMPQESVSDSRGIWLGYVFW